MTARALALLLAGCPNGNGADADVAPDADGAPDAEIDPDAPPPLVVGAPCETDDDCLALQATDGLVCLRRAWGFRDGYCTRLDVGSERDCTAIDWESRRVPFLCAGATCMHRCESGADCRPGYECLPGVGGCWPRCEPGRACPLPPPRVCEVDDQCDDGDPCTTDGCVNGICASARMADRPRRVARLATRGPAIDVDFTGTLGDDSLQLLVAEGDEGVEVIDLGNPSQPALRFRLETSGKAVSVVRIEDRIVVAQELAGLELFLSGGGSAIAAATVANGAGSAVGLSPANRFVYAYRHGAYLLDVGGATLSGPCDTRGRAVDGVWVSSARTLLVADSLAGLAVCEWPESGPPSQLERIDTDGRMAALSARGNILAAAEGGAGVGIFDISRPRSPVRRDMTAPLAGEAVDVRMVGGSTVVVAASAGGVYAFSLSDCTVPELWYRWETDGPALAIDEQDAVVAVALGEAGVEILDLGCRAATED